MVKRTTNPKTALKANQKAPSVKPAAVPKLAAGDERWTLESIKSLVAFINEQKVQQFDLELGEFKIHVTSQYYMGKESNRMPSFMPMMPQIANTVLPAAPEPVPAAPAVEKEAPQAVAQVAEKKKEDNYTEIKSPMVGTFYRAPSPESPPYVEVGDHVNAETVLCIVEAMKLMNEIKAEMRGQIMEILVENGQPVEYGQPMFKVKPSV